MLVKISKRFIKFDVNDFLHDKGHKAEAIDTLELMAKHACEIEIDLVPLKNLTKLYFYGNGETTLNVRGVAPIEILKMRGIKNCREIHLSENTPVRILQLAECNLHALPSWIYKLRSIETLELQKNRLTDLPIEFEWLRNIKRLNLDGNLFQDVPRVLANLSNLNHLSCDGNKIGPQKLRDFLRLLNS